MDIASVGMMVEMGSGGGFCRSLFGSDTVKKHKGKAIISLMVNTRCIQYTWKPVYGVQC